MLKNNMLCFIFNTLIKMILIFENIIIKNNQITLLFIYSYVYFKLNITIILSIYISKIVLSIIIFDHQCHRHHRLLANYYGARLGPINIIVIQNFI